GRAVAGAAYLRVFELESSWVFPMPPVGEVYVGRGDGLGLRLRDPSVSRRHLKITCFGDDASVEDAGSQNGTLVNGEPLVGARMLASGDVIALGDTQLVHHGRAPRAAASFVELRRLRERADGEVERALRHGRSFA